MREIVLDTETTGLEPAEGHRLVEIACVELRNHVATDRHWQRYLNPERDMPEDAYRIHGLSIAFLEKHRTFAEEVDDFLAFIGDDPLVIHNADFDLKFLNAELTALDRPPLQRARVVDTLALARQRYPGARASLDALCQRFGIDNSDRTLHGALLDARLLADVYLELRGGRQVGLDLARDAAAAAIVEGEALGGRPRRAPRPHAPSAEELAAHAAMLDKLKDPLWRR
ncbi:MAG: DNA polymerase III subunit epsilon [Thalassobaculales bacterium]